MPRSCDRLTLATRNLPFPLARVRSLFNWSIPLVTKMIMAVLCVATVALYVLPLRIVLCLAGSRVFIKKGLQHYQPFGMFKPPPRHAIPLPMAILSTYSARAADIAVGVSLPPPLPPSLLLSPVAPGMPPPPPFTVFGRALTLSRTAPLPRTLLPRSCGGCQAGFRPPWTRSSANTSNRTWRVVAASSPRTRRRGAEDPVAVPWHPSDATRTRLPYT